MTSKNGKGSPEGTKTNKALSYARVSSKEQEKEGFSIAAQQKLLQFHARERNPSPSTRNLSMWRRPRETGRASFNGDGAIPQEASNTVRTVLVEKTDRLYRNLKDWVTLDELDIEIHLIKEGIVLSRDSPLVGEVRPRHQGTDGQELHRQSVGGSPQGPAGEGRARFLANQGSAWLSQRPRPRRQAHHRARSRRCPHHRQDVRLVRPPATYSMQEIAEMARGRRPRLPPHWRCRAHERGAYRPAQPHLYRRVRLEGQALQGQASAADLLSTSSSACRM